MPGRFNDRVAVARAIEQLRGGGVTVALEAVLSQSACDALESRLVVPVSDEEYAALLDEVAARLNSAKRDETAGLLAALETARPKPGQGPGQPGAGGGK